MTQALPPWAADAAPLPLAFAQVREAPRIDQHLIERAGARARVCFDVGIDGTRVK